MPCFDGPDFSGYERDALCDDAAFGSKRWHRFARLAVVSESAWLRAAITTFSPVVPSEIRVFGLAEPAAAKDWIARKEETTARCWK